jgi:hypothetical protein
MRVIGATFIEGGDAERALAELRQTFQVGPSDASLAQLGSSGSERGDLTLLAGHFPDDRVEQIRQSMVSHGGKIVTDVDEAATRSRATPPPASAGRPLGAQEASAVGRGAGRQREEYFAR